MTGIVSELQFAEGIAVTPPTNISLATSTASLGEYPDDASFLSATPSGNIYINTTLGTVRILEDGAWINLVPDAPPDDRSKRFRIEWGSFGTAATATLVPSGASSMSATFPGSGVVLYRDDFATVNNKYLSGGAISPERRWLVPKGPTTTLTGLSNQEAEIAFDTTLGSFVGNNGTAWGPLGGGGGGGGGGAVWNPVVGSEPIGAQENGELVYLFTQAGTEKLSLFLKVPESYQAGKQVLGYISLYSPGTGLVTMLLKATCYLIKKDTDAISSTTNSHATTNSALTNSVADQYRQAVLDLSDSSGEINGQPIAAGDILKIVLSRDNTDTDTNEVRFIPSATEFKFS